MIEKNFITDLSIKWQTTEINVLREYLQHCFLTNLYKNKEAQKLLFKGGTALRIVYQSPRFSEDLDFTSIVNSVKTIEGLIENTLIQLQYEGINLEISEAKSTTGGYFFNSQTTIYDKKIDIKLNFTTRKTANGEVNIISSVFLPPYNLISLKRKDLVYEKITALLVRQKIRDFFDLYFILRAQMGKEAVGNRIKEVRKIIRSSKENFTELKQFLPKNFWPIIKDLKKSLINELERFG